MPSLADFHRYGEELEKLLHLRTSPIAVKMLRTEADIPEGAVRPKRDRGQHIAQCQAFALSRRNRETVAMLIEDNWCFAPLIAYGLVDKPDDPELAPFVNFPRFERDKYVGICSAPLGTSPFVPDVVLIYSNTAQLRSLMNPLHFQKDMRVDSCFFPPACAYQVIPVMGEGNYMVTLPDPGDYMRALAGEDEIILSVPAAKMEELMTGLRRMEEMHAGYRESNLMMRPDFERPEFYQRLFKRWGLDNEIDS